MPQPRRVETAQGDKELTGPPLEFITLDPQYHVVTSGGRLLRVYAPRRHAAAPTHFRSWGPYNRFDHQRPGPDGQRRVDRARSILYAAYTLTCCVGEYFGDQGEIVRTGNHLAALTVTRPITLLDIAGTAATGAGTIPAISGITQRATTQAWARWWYEHPQLAAIDGLLFTASHSGEDAVALWERARRKVASPAAQQWSLQDVAVADDLHLAAHQLHLPIE